MCLFCDLTPIKSQILAKYDLYNIVLDGMPISPGHTLIIPKKHIVSILDLPQKEFSALKQTINDTYELINSIDWQEKYKEVLDTNKNESSKLFIDRVLKNSNLGKSIMDFNLGVNNGTNAGRTIEHLHIHLIPRYEGDVPDAIGGVRHIIPGMGNYKNPEFKTILNTLIKQ